MDKETAKLKIAELVEKYATQTEAYEQTDYNEAQTKIDFITPLFEILGWDIDNEKGKIQYFREVIQEDRVRVDGRVKHPDYAFRLGNTTLFYVEAKKPSVSVKEDKELAFQLRRYGWNAGLTISLLTNFREFAVYDCRVKPNQKDKAHIARLAYFTYQDLTQTQGISTDKRNGFDFLWDTFTQDNISRGSFEKLIKEDGDRFARSVLPVDKDFLRLLVTWRERLAKSLISSNKQINEDELNLSIQQFLDRIVFLRVAEDRGLEQKNTLKNTVNTGGFYKNLYKIFVKAEQKYNSGLFDFDKDKISKTLVVDDRVVKKIIVDLYEHNPYDFELIPVEILGRAYEQFLGKTITLTQKRRIKIEEKPAIREAGGVYYTPPSIVNYIIQHAFKKLLEGKTPKEVAKIKIVDPACGSGGFLLGAYQYLIDWHLDYYKTDYRKRDKQSRGLKTDTITPDGKLSTVIKKQILRNNIFGVDIDANAVEITKLSLLLKCLEGETAGSIENFLIYERVLPSLDDNIQDGNSLVDTDFYDVHLPLHEVKRVKPFNWQQTFPEVFQQGGFDAVIGNPPWVSLKGKFGHKILHPKVQQYLQIKYEGNTAMPNLYEYFIKRGLALFNKSGVFSLIVPDRLGYNDQFIPLRKKILENYHIEELLYKVPFPDIIADTLIFRFVQRTSKNATQPIVVGEYGKRPQKKIAADFLSEARHRFCYESSDEVAILLDKIQKNPRCQPLGLIVQTTSGVGAKKSEITEQRKNQRQIEILRGRSVLRYSLGKTYFFEFKPENITGRTVDRKKLGVKEKVLLRKTGFPLFATYDNSGIYPEQSLYFLFNNHSDNSLKYIAAVLNSKLFQFFYINRLVTNKDSTPQIKKVDLDRFPLYLCEGPDKQSHDSIVQYVDCLLQLYERKNTLLLSQHSRHVDREIKHYEGEIDVLIYQLYGVTDDADIALMENSQRNHNLERESS